jgi:hypothetical protein
MANRPRKPSKESEAQRTNRDRFADATGFARKMMNDPVKKAYYWNRAKKLRLPNAYTAAITDYMRGTVKETGAGSQKPGVRKNRSRGYVQPTGRGTVDGAKTAIRNAGEMGRERKALRRKYFNNMLRPLHFAWQAWRSYTSSMRLNPGFPDEQEHEVLRKPVSRAGAPGRENARAKDCHAV